MEFPVKFKASVTGTILDLTVLIQNELVDSNGRKVNVTENYSSHGNMQVIFRVSGLNGTDFKITYECNSSNDPRFDVTKPSPVEDTITNFGFKQITLNIPV